MVKALRVLIIDDEPELRQALRATLEEDGDWEVEDHDFAGLESALARFRPDLIVLDLVEGWPPTDEDTGNASFDKIRDAWFCPVVVYSAYPDQQHFEHPLVDTVTKGAGTENVVRDRLAGFVPEATLIRSVHQDFDGRIREALRDSVPLLRRQIGTVAEDDNTVLVRAVRRLVAARVDDVASGDGLLRAWERFVVPPLGEHLLTADLLRCPGADWTEQSAFRLVLTPSCDLVPQGGRRPRAERVLVAPCEPLHKIGKIELAPGTALSNKKRESLQTILTEGMADNLLPIPRFQGHIPSMVANLKRLDLVEWREPVDAEGRWEVTGFERVASTDSPFRELVVWAFLRVSGRPGVPRLDVAGWLDDINEELKGLAQP